MKIKINITPKKSNVEFILFAIKQAKEAEAFGFTRNLCCRNLKIAIHQYWQSKELKMHGQSHKKNIPRSKEARKKPLKQCQVEHAVPLMWIVNNLMNMKPLTSEGIKEFLKKYFRVLLVTKKEHAKLNASGMRSTMPKDWDNESVWARYEKVGIKQTAN